MKIHESAEDYLEKILMLQEQKGSVRSIDIAVAMGFSKPSVSVAMKNLRENGYISMDPDGYIKLEAPGMEIAQRIARDDGCGALITGENLGQVASQTMEAMTVTGAVVDMPIFMPLVGMDKKDIIAIAATNAVR